MGWRELPTLSGILLVNLLTIGTIGPAMSFFLVDFNQALDDSSAATIGLTQSLYFGAISICGPLAVILTKRVGDKEAIIIGCAMVSGGMIMTSFATSVWQLFITHSLVSGIGTSLMVTSMVFIIGHHFSGSAVYLGFLYAGSASGMLVTPIFCAEVKLHFGFRGTLLILGALSLHSIPISQLIFKNYSKKRSKLSIINEKLTNGDVDRTSIIEDENATNTTTLINGKTKMETSTSEKSDLQLNEESKKVSILGVFLMYPNLIILCIVRALAEYAYLGFFIHFTASVIYKGVSERNAAFALAFYGLGSLTGRLTAFVPEHLHLLKKANSFMMSMLIVGTLSVVFDYIRNVYIIIITAVLIGYFVGWYLILFPAIVKDSVSKERFKDVYGFIGVPGGILSMLAGYTVGLIYDASGLYKLSFFIAGGIFILNGVLMFIRDIGLKLKHEQKYEGADITANV